MKLPPTTSFLLCLYVVALLPSTTNGKDETEQTKRQRNLPRKGDGREGLLVDSTGSMRGSLGRRMKMTKMDVTEETVNDLYGADPYPDEVEINPTIDETEAESSFFRDRRFIITLEDSVLPTEIENLAFSIARIFGVVPENIFKQAIKGFTITLPGFQAASLEASTPESGFADDGSFVASSMQDEPLKFQSQSVLGQFAGFIKGISEDRILEAQQRDTRATGLWRMNAHKAAFWPPESMADIPGVAVLDTGVDDHPDLNICDGVSFVNSEPSYIDKNGHGTHVAGTACGEKTGVAPGCCIYAVKVLGSDGSGYISSIIEGMEWVIEHSDKISAMNLSLGGRGSASTCNYDTCSCRGDPFHEASCNVVRSGVVVVAAAGNSGGNSNYFTPANFDEAITVSAVADSDGEPGGKGPKVRNDKDDTLASFSNWGAAVDIACSGVSVFSTWKNNKYNSISGTSMASPHVAGAVVLFAARYGFDKNADGVAYVKDRLVNEMADPQKGSRGFNDYRNDGYEEPMCNVEAMNAVDSAATRVVVMLDKNSYEPGDDDAVITVTVTDENNDAKTGLPASAFSLSASFGGAVTPLSVDSSVSGTVGAQQFWPWPWPQPEQQTPNPTPAPTPSPTPKPTPAPTAKSPNAWFPWPWTPDNGKPGTPEQTPPSPSPRPNPEVADPPEQGGWTEEAGGVYTYAQSLEDFPTDVPITITVAVSDLQDDTKGSGFDTFVKQSSVIPKSYVQSITYSYTSSNQRLNLDVKIFPEMAGAKVTLELFRGDDPNDDLTYLGQGNTETDESGELKFFLTAPSDGYYMADVTNINAEVNGVIYTFDDAAFTDPGYMFTQP